MSKGIRGESFHITELKENEDLEYFQVFESGEFSKKIYEIEELLNSYISVNLEGVDILVFLETLKQYRTLATTWNMLYSIEEEASKYNVNKYKQYEPNTTERQTERPTRNISNNIDKPKRIQQEIDKPIRNSGTSFIDDILNLDKPIRNDNK